MQYLRQLVNQSTGITCDSRDVKPGYIFIALRGYNTDGNLYIAEAIRQGALAIVSDCPPLSHLPIPMFTVPNARKTLAELAAQFYGHPSAKLALAGVTGTNGKTTIAHMLEHIFQHAGRKAGLIGTVCVNTGNKSKRSILTTPDAVSLQSYLAEMVNSKVTHAVMEVSAQGMDLHRTDCLNLAVGIITNISPDHFDFHGDYSSYIASKKKFFSLLSPTTPLIANTADSNCRELLKDYRGPLITAAAGSHTDLSVEVNYSTVFGSSFTIKVNQWLSKIAGSYIPLDRLHCRLLIPGLHNVDNALLAAGAALLMDIPPDCIVAALASFRPVERRMVLSHLDSRTILDDTALNPGSIDAVLKTIASFPTRPIIVVNAIRGQRGCQINSENAAALACWQQCLPIELVITSSNDYVNKDNAVTLEERSAFLDTLDYHCARYVYYDNLYDALAEAWNSTTAGSLLALIGAQGMDEGCKVLTDLVTETNCPSPLVEQTPLQPAMAAW